MANVTSVTDKTTTTWDFPVYFGKIDIVPEPTLKKITLIFQTTTTKQQFLEKYRSFEDPEGQKYSVSESANLFQLNIPLRPCDEKPVTAALTALCYTMHRENYEFTYSE